MTLDLKNTQKRTLTFNLAHSSLREAPAPFGYVVIQGGSQVFDPKTGKVGVKKTKKRVPASISFLPDEEKKGLPSCLKECPEVRSALASRALKVTGERSEDTSAKKR
jgi:hypothetical protein